MGFLTGLFFGVIVAGGSSPPPLSSLGAIPFRCLAAFEVSDADYKACRRLSLRLELSDRTPCLPHQITGDDPYCSFERHVGWELSGLRALRAAAEKAAQPKQ